MKTQMSNNGTQMIEADYNTYEHQTCYVFAPTTAPNVVVPLRPSKRRKILRPNENAQSLLERSQVVFPALYSGNESDTSVHTRQCLFEDFWAFIEKKIQHILHDANEDTLAKVAQFIDEKSDSGYGAQIPTALIVTGLNIASQELLFDQLAGRLRFDEYVPVVLLRSSDAPNMKTLLKKLIRDATSQKGRDDEEAKIMQTNGHKLLNYDLQILYDHLKTSNRKRVVVAFQDSEAFESGILSDTLLLFNSWRDRIQIVVLLGIATSVELFQERLPRTLARCIDGVQFDVEQTSKTLERVFQKVVAGSNIPLLLGPIFVTSLLERQHDHAQSLQSFISALKYAYMCHFYSNPLSALLDHDTVTRGLQDENIEAIRILPSFRRRIETLLDHRKLEYARNLLESDQALLGEVRKTTEGRGKLITKLRRNMHLLATLGSQEGKPINRIELYIKAFSGQLEESDLLKESLESIRTLSPQEAILLMKKLSQEIASGDPGSDLEGWSKDAQPFQKEISRLVSAVETLLADSDATGTPVRSKYVLQSKAVRATVVAQKVQLSREKSSLSELDQSYSIVLDELSGLLKQQLRFENPKSVFLNELWIYDSKSPHLEVFSPKARYAVERALSIPHDYLSCTCCKASEVGLSSSQPPTAIIYQLYLESGSLINIFDLWSAFYAIIGGDEANDYDEKVVFALFYRALADLKLLGMVKQSRRKTDHLTKLAWKGL